MTSSNGNGPPHDEPPPADNSPAEDGDSDESGNLVQYIHQVVDSKLDQHLAEINGRFEHLGNLIGEVSQAINHLAKNQGYAVPEAQNGAIQPLDNPGAAPMESGGKKNMGDAVAAFLYQVLEHPGEFGEGIGRLFGGVAQARVAMRTPDTDAVLRNIALTEPQKLLAYVPDPLGGKLPDYLLDTMRKGIAIGAAAKAGKTGPLDGQPLGPSGSPSGPSNGLTPSAASSSFADLSNDELDMAMAQLMQVRVGRTP